MKNVFKFLFIILLVFSSLSVLFAVETVRGEVEFNIRFYDRRIYYVTTDPIFVQVTITNNSPVPYRFKLADERAFSIDFDTRTMTNRQVPEADSLIRKRTQNNQVFFREVAIESGESFSFVEDLKDYIAFSQPGSYRVKAKVYPELYRSSQSAGLESNYLNLSIRPALIQGPDGIPLEMDVATGAVLVRQPLSPDAVVTYMLTARQQSQWERFFLYLDLEAMLSRDPLQRRRWQAENEEGRRRMTAEYRQNLQNAVVDGDISVIPTSFEILRTVYDNNEGKVTALLRFRHPNYTELRRYTYDLEKKDNFWIIVNYSVEGLGTTANN
ncbi:MAG: hypothetical protein LBU88_00105 [Treponema sp.]|jgi:hypothetical protein|nr:hypothetical protein [Treponema sp.]